MCAGSSCRSRPAARHRAESPRRTVDCESPLAIHTVRVLRWSIFLFLVLAFAMRLAGARVQPGVVGRPRSLVCASRVGRPASATAAAAGGWRIPTE
jgi:hypothetical protein